MNSQSIYLPTEHKRPAWYKIGLTEDGKSLVIWIHQMAVTYLSHLKWAERTDIPYIQKTYQLGVFVPPVAGRDFGFHNCLKFRTAVDGTWFKWELSLPVLYNPGCDHETLLKEEKAIRNTLSILFQELYFFEGDTNYLQNQLILIHDMCIAQGGISSMKTTITPAAIPWIQSQIGNSDVAEQRMIAAMIAADSHMWNRTAGLAARVEFREPHMIYMSTSGGQASGFEPCLVSGATKNSGYEMVTHNVSSALTQLTLMSGVARLHDLMMETV